MKFFFFDHLNLFGKNRKTNSEKHQEAFKEFKRQRDKLFEQLRNNPRPEYHSTQPEQDNYSSQFKQGKHGKYGRIYGDQPGDWKQTKPPAPGKKLDLNKGKWKPQFTPDDVIVVDVMQLTGYNLVKLIVKDLFVIEIKDIDRFKMQQYNLSFNKNIDQNTCKLFVEHCIQIGVLPTPMEELV